MAGGSGGARAAHRAAGQGLGHGAGLLSTTDVQPGRVEDIFKLLSERLEEKNQLLETIFFV